MTISKPNAAQIKAALAYFERQGIDPREEPTPGTHPSVDPPAPSSMANVTTGMTTNACIIEVLSILFYTYCKVTIPDIGHEFEGHSGGLGAGDLTAAGAIYYDNLKALISTKDFGVFFAAEDGGVVQVTWGSNGNATAAGVGDALGAFGGRGSWS